MEVQFAGKIIEPLWGGFSSGAGTSISTQGPARVASEGVSMDCRGTGEVVSCDQGMLIWDSKWLGRSVDAIFYDNLDGWYWVSPFAILAWFTGDSSSWQNHAQHHLSKKKPSTAIWSKRSQNIPIELAGSVPKVVQLDWWRERLDQWYEPRIPLRKILKILGPEDSHLIQRSPQICIPNVFFFEAVPPTFLAI